MCIYPLDLILTRFIESTVRAGSNILRDNEVCSLSRPLLLAGPASESQAATAGEMMDLCRVLKTFNQDSRFPYNSQDFLKEQL